MAIIINIDVMLAKRKSKRHPTVAACRHHHGQSLHPENRKSEGDPLLDPGSQILKPWTANPGYLEYREDKEGIAMLRPHNLEIQGKPLVRHSANIHNPW